VLVKVGDSDRHSLTPSFFLVFLVLVFLELTSGFYLDVEFSLQPHGHAMKVWGGRI
jgi:hypothetical protein